MTKETMGNVSAVLFLAWFFNIPVLLAAGGEHCMRDNVVTASVFWASFSFLVIDPIFFCLFSWWEGREGRPTSSEEGSQEAVESAESQSNEDDEASAEDFEQWLREEEARKRIAKRQRSEQKRMLRYVFSMMAKIAKADGKVVREEVEAAQQVFGSLDFANAFHDFCVKVFNTAKDNRQSVYWYAAELVKLGGNVESRYFVYELLWDVACADGVLAKEEKEILKVICGYLQLPFSAYEKAYACRVAMDDIEDEESPGGENHEIAMTIGAAYELLGCDERVPDKELKRVYHEMAKRYHPDILRAANMPEDLIAFANAKMVRLNEAWELVRHDRGI